MTRIIKKTAILIAAVLLSCANLWAASSSGKCGENLIWRLNGIGKLEIYGTGKMYDYDFSFYPSPWKNDSSIKEIEILIGITSIGNSAFFGCSGLTSVTIPKSVASIGDYAFLGCSGLTSVTIPDIVTSIGNYTFYGCSGLTSVTIPNSVTSIGDYVFWACNGLTSVTIPNCVTSIGREAFLGCSGLTSLTIPNSVTSIGNLAFSDCSGLNKIQVATDNKVYDSRDNCNAIIETATNTLITGCKSTKIPNSVTSIRKDAFYGCNGLTSVTIPNSVTSIGNSAFLGCSGLTSVTIPNSVTSIGNHAFYRCSGLTSVTIPNSVTNIEHSVFRKCSGLTSVTIPNSVTNIGDGAFFGCSGLTSATIPNSVTSIENHAFRDCGGLTKISVSAKTPPVCGDKVFDGVDKQKCELAVPQESLEAYKSADTWKDFQNITTSGIEGIEADEVKVTVANGEISINGVADDAEVEIYGANGVMIYRGTNKTIAMPSPGIYIVRVAGKNIKIAL